MEIKPEQVTTLLAEYRGDTPYNVAAEKAGIPVGEGNLALTSFLINVLPDRNDVREFDHVSEQEMARIIAEVASSLDYDPNDTEALKKVANATRAKIRLAHREQK